MKEKIKAIKISVPLSAILGLLVLNAIYIYGLSFYQGYIEELGFEYALFPIEWSDTSFWSYQASWYFGIEIVESWGLSPLLVSLCILAIYLCVYYLVKGAFRALKSELLIPKSGLANFFLQVNLSLLFQFAIISFLFIWIFLPINAHEHGQKVAKNKWTEKKRDSSLCAVSIDAKEPCISIKAPPSINDYNESKEIKGLLMFKREEYIGIYTEDGAVTMTMPKDYLLRNGVIYTQ